MSIELEDIFDWFPWLVDLPPDVSWAWVRLYVYVAKHGRPAGVVNSRDFFDLLMGLKRGDSFVGPYIKMVSAAKEAKALTFVKAKMVIPSLADPRSLAPSTLRMRKLRAKGKPDNHLMPRYTSEDAQRDRRALKEKGFKTPTGFAKALVVGMNLMCLKGETDLSDRLMDHFLRESRIPLCPITWLNQFVGSVLGCEVNLTYGVSRRKARPATNPKSKNPRKKPA